MIRTVFITGIVAVALITICVGQPCPGTPSPCWTTNHLGKGICVHVFFNDTGSSWNELQNVCQHDGGKLVWLRDDFNIVNMLHMVGSFGHVYKGSLVVLGLLSSTVDKVGLFWAASPINTSSYQCTSTETAVCMPSSNNDNCSAIGCCWRNGKCQYPNSQHLSVFNQSVEYYNISGNDQRQCVGYQLNINSTTEGHWVTYDCFKPLYNAVYACEYKCNIAVWPNTTITDFTYGEEKNNLSSSETGPTHETPESTTLEPKENHTNLQSTLSEPGPTHETPESTTLIPKENHTNLESTLSSEPGPTHVTPKSTTLKPKENHMNLESTLPIVSGETWKPTTHKPEGNQKNTTPNELGGTPKPTANKSKENRMTLDNTSSRLINLIFNVYIN